MLMLNFLHHLWHSVFLIIINFYNFIRFLYVMNASMQYKVVSNNIGACSNILKYDPY